MRHPVPVFCAAALALLAITAAGAPLLRPTDRILFCGDSITGHSMNLADGYCNQMTWALKQAHPASSNTLVSLGGSGQGVASWMGIATCSATNVRYLDVRGVEVAKTLDSGTDILVVMLGMNDLLSPYFGNGTNDVANWRARYTNLVQVLRQRTHPRVVALGTITLLTEDEASPKNAARLELNRQVAALAAEEGCLVFPTGEATHDLLRRGRMLNPRFHVAGDFVHPGSAGHAAIAMAMLNGLGEGKAAQLIEERYLGALVPSNAYPVLSYEVAAGRPRLDTPTNTYTVAYTWSAGPVPVPPATVTLALPSGWHLDSQARTATSGVFTVSGIPGRRITELLLAAQAGGLVRTQVVAIPAPWRISAGMGNPSAWPRTPGFTFDPARSVQAFDQALIDGTGLSAPVVDDRGRAYPWMIHTPSVNYTGGDDPASIDPFAVCYGNTFDALYAARWVYSAKARPVNLRLTTSVFAGTIGLNVWVNGQNRYAGCLTSEPARTVVAAADLHEGWNRLLIKGDHLNWQWQFACALEGQGDDALDDLRYLAVPPAGDAP